MLVLRDAPDPAALRNLPLVMKIWHALPGLYLWEFLTTLEYEWKVIRGRLPYRWTIWVYSVTRVSTLLAIILLIVCRDVHTIENCKVTPKFHFTFTYLAFASASLLLLLRIIAIWNYKKVVVWTAICLWVINVAFLLQGIIRIKIVWLPDEHACAAANVDGVELSLIVTLVTDMLMLVTILVGLFRLRQYGGSFGVQGLLWKQGIAWLMLGALAEIPPVVLIILNLNADINLLLQFPSLVIMSIAAARMHRSLVEFASGSTNIACDTVGIGAPSIPKTTQTAAIAAIQITLNEGGDKHSTYEQYLGPQSRERDSRIGMSEQRCDTQNRPVSNGNLESGMEKSVQ